MNILELVPALEGIIGKVVQDPNQAGNLKLELAKLNVQQEIERLKVQQSWLSNKSVFVAGAIPTILWMLSIVVAFNHIIAPLLSWMSGAVLPVLELPPYYTDLAGTVVLGLFAKKAWDGSTIEKIGKVRKEEEPPVCTVVETPPKASSIPKDDPEYYDKRLREIQARYGLKEEEK